MTALETGRMGEDYAARWLLERGYRLVFRNYHSRYVEIDLIAQKDQVLAFIEVKTRNQDAIAAPCEWVTPAKRRRLIKTALLYLQENPSRLQPRFDVVEIITENRNEFAVFSIHHIENAFWLEGTV